MVAEVMINFRSALRRASRLFKWAEQKVNVQAALMSLIQDDGIVFREVGIALCFRQQDAVRHQLDVRLVAGPVVETNFAADLAAPCDVQLLGDPARDRKRRNAPGLRATDLGLNPKAGFKTHFGNLCRLARSRFTRNDDDLTRANGGDDLILARRDRKFRWVSHLGDIEPAPPLTQALSSHESPATNRSSNASC